MEIQAAALTLSNKVESILFLLLHTLLSFLCEALSFWPILERKNKYWIMILNIFRENIKQYQIILYSETNVSHK